MNLKLKENKWLYAFIAASVVLVAAIIVAVVLGVSLSKANEVPDYVEGPEVGTYYYDVSDGEVLLTLSGGNNFTLSGPQLNKSGTYTVTDKSMVLDFVRDEDGTTTATINGDSIALVYNEATMTFLKKVNYTVTFQVNGGSEITAASIVNGKTVAKPADPTKEGSVFLGWYADEALTVPYTFGSTTIKADATVYAKWAQLGAIGVSDYTISFDLGYDGAAAIDSIKTIGGIAYGVTTPVREGYTFGGWWISMYEDGEKLSYAYNEKVVFEANTTLYAVWYDNASEKLNAPKVSVSDSTIKWEAVDGASGYKIVITDASGNVILPEENVGTTTKNFSFENYPAGEYVVSVTAVAANTDKNSEAAVRYYANKTLDRVSSFSVIDGILVFNSVEGAEKYYITIDCGNDKHAHTLFDNGNSTNFLLANCPMQEGGIKITVTATATGHASSVSATYVYEKKLDKISGITYDEATDAFIWNEVENAISYTVSITVDGQTYTVSNGNKTSFSIANYTGEIAISVTPVREGYNSPEAVTATAAKIVPAVPTGLTVNGKIVSWNAVNATSYELKIGSQIIKVDTNSYDLDAGDITLTNGEQYTISVKAINGNESSAYSEALTFGFLVMNPTLTYSNNTVYWTPVIGATNYLVRVNGGETIQVSGECSAKVTLTKAGINTIEVRYTDLGGSKWVSMEVTAYAVTYMSRSLAGEITEYVAVGDTMLLPDTYTYDGFTFDGWYNTINAAAGNGKKYTTATFTGNGDIVLYANWAPRSYNINLQVDGYNISNIQANTSASATYTQDYQILPIPESTNADNTTFLGWYTEPQGNGTQLTDENGVSVSSYPFTRDTIAYPFFDAGVLSYKLKADGTYAVRAGKLINRVRNVTIPTTYDGKPVTAVLENAFANCSRLVSIKIPDTVELVGTGAFSGCSRLEHIEVYEVEGNHERFYASDDGALIRYDMGTTFLEVVPRAKTGTYVMSEEINVIRIKAFEYSNLESVVISTSVTKVSSQAFYRCSKLEAIDFIDGRTVPVAFEDDAFYRCTEVSSIKIPATVNDISITMLQSLPSLTTIIVEDGHTAYGSVAGMLTNNLQDTIVFVPNAYISGSFTVPQGIQHIGERAFEFCVGLTEVNVPNYVKTIGANAFNGCTGIKAINFAGSRNNPLTIGDNAFAGCKALKSVTFGGSGSDAVDAGAVTIGANAFAPATAADASLQTVIFEDGANIAMIGDYAFANQRLLATVNFNKANISAIGNYAFYGDKGLRAIVIPSSTSSVGEGAFAECSGLGTLTIEEGRETLDFGNAAFNNCTGLTTIHIPSTVKAFNGSVFGGCNAIRVIDVDENNTYLKAIDGVLYDYDVTRLIFYPMGRVTEKNGVVNDLPATLTTIDADVFKNNIDLTSIVISAKITTIGDSAFYNCKGLTSIVFETEGGTTLTIGASAFVACPFTSIELPSYTTSIGASAFEATKFASFTIPANLTTISTNLFKGNTALTSITIPAKVASIGDGAFYGCSKLSSLTIEGGDVPLTIGTLEASQSTGVFVGAKIKDVTLPDRVTMVGAYAFSNSSYWSNTTTSFTAGKNLTVVGPYAFYNAKNLASVTLNNGLTSIGAYAFYNAQKLTSVTIPNTVTLIDTNAFAGQNSSYACIKSLTFEEGGTAPLTIGNYAFRYLQATDIQIPARALAYKEGLDNTLYTVSETNYATYKTFMVIFYDSTKLANVWVEEGSKDFTSINGILYEIDENGTPVTLLYCPPAHEGVLVDGKKTVTIPKTVTMVEYGSFYQTTKLDSIIFEEYDKSDENYGKQLLYLGSFIDLDKGSRPSEYCGIFSGTNNSITYVKAPSHLAYIGANAFCMRNASVIDFNKDATVTVAAVAFRTLNVETLDLPNVEAFGQQRIFMDSAKIKAITFGANSTFTTIPDYCFDGCESLTSIEIPASVTSIDTGAFYQCKALTSVTFAKGSQLTSIGSSAFQETALTSFTFPDGVTSLTSGMFYKCTQLKEVTLPAGLTDFSAALFRDCNTVEKINLSADNVIFELVDGVLYNQAGTILYYFPSAKEVTEYTVPEGIIDIKDYAFYYFPGSTVKLPASLETIGNYAFNESSITAIDIPAKVQSIGGYAFYTCEKLERVTMVTNGNLKSIGDYAFSKYSGQDRSPVTVLKEVTFCDNIESIGTGAFNGCTELTSVIIPKALKSLPTNAFYGCISLQSVTLQEGIELIGHSAFSVWGDYSALESIHIPASVKTIQNNVFANQRHLASVTFAENSALESIGNSIFSGCSALVEIDLSDAASLTSIGTTLFKGTTSLETVLLEGTAITNLPEATFSGCTALTTVTFPETLETISKQAFMGCTALYTIEIPAKVKEIGTGAFENCTGLTTVTFATGSQLTTLGTTSAAADNIFKNTTSLETVVLPSDIIAIGGHVFENSGVKEIELPASLTTIGDYAFNNCDRLGNIAIYGNVTYLGNYAFYDCDGLVTAELSSGLIYIGDLAFGFCEQLSAAFIPDTVTTISGNPYAGCSGITSFMLDENNEAYKVDQESGALYDSTMQTLIWYPASITDETPTFPSTVTVIGAGAFAGASFKTVVIPSRIIAIPDYAFATCPNLETIMLHNGVTTIGNNAFESCPKLNNVKIPAGVVNIGNYAFSNCDSLSNFEFGEKNTTTDKPYSIGSHLFDGCDAITEVILPSYMTPANSIPAYMFANTGIVNAVVPEQITKTNTAGVFANCAKLEAVKFLGVDLSVEISYWSPNFGDYYFYNCPLLTTVSDNIESTPDNKFFGVGAYAFAECKSLKLAGIYGYTIIGAHAFENSGLENFYFTPYDYYGHASYYEIHDYAFAGCTNIKKLILPMGASQDQCMLFGSHLFDGWTADQVIWMPNDEEGFGDYWAMWDTTLFDGCEAPVLYKDDIFSMETVDMEYFGMYMSRELAGFTNVKTLNIYTITKANDSYTTVLDGSVFDGWTAEQTINFKNYSYKELLDCFTDGTFSAAVFKGCSANIMDKDGNQIVFDVETGAVINVVDADGNVIYTPAE